MDEDAEELQVADCWAQLRTAEVGRIARVVDGHAEIRPVNFAVDHGSLLVRTAPQSWIARCAGGPVVFESDGTTAADEGGRLVWSVLVEGTARTVTTTAELIDTIGADPLPWHASPKPVFLRIEPTRVTGRRFLKTDPGIWHNPMQGARRRPVE